MKIQNWTVCGLCAAAVSLAACQDVVDYNEGYDDGMTSTGAPAISAIYNAEDRDMTTPLTAGAFEEMLMLSGSNLSQVRKVMLNDVEVPLSEVYATAKAAYFPIPRQVPGEVNNRLYYETALGNTSYDFTVNVPRLQLRGLYNEFAAPGTSVKVDGAYFDLYGFGGENPTASIRLNGAELPIDSLSEQYMSVKLPDNAPDNAQIVFSWTESDGPHTVSVPYRPTDALLWNLSDPASCGLWAGTELITDGSRDGDPKPTHGSYFRIKGSFDAWSWNNLPCGGCNVPAEAAANPAGYWFKFEVNSATGNPFYDAPSNGYIIQLNSGWYTWNPGSFNTYGNWYTVRLDLAAVATNGLNAGWNNLFWIMQPTGNWNVDHSFANIRIEKK